MSTPLTSEGKLLLSELHNIILQTLKFYDPHKKYFRCLLVIVGVIFGGWSVLSVVGEVGGLLPTGAAVSVDGQEESSHQEHETEVEKELVEQRDGDLYHCNVQHSSQSLRNVPQSRHQIPAH